MPCGVYQSEADGEHHFSYVSESMLNMLGYSRKAFQEKFRSTRDLVYHEDREQVDEAVLRQIQRSNGVSCEFRVELPDGSLKWVCSQGRMTTDANGKRWFYVCMMDYDYLKERLQEQEWQQQKYRTLAEVPGMIVFDYDPLRDRMTVERTQASGAIDTMVVEKFIEDIEHHPWLSKENVDNQRRVLLELSNHQGTGNTEFKACLAGDSEFCWYRTYVRSIVNESGKVYRIVGRSDKLQDENKWMDGPVSKTVLDLPAQEKQTVLEYANNEAIVNEGLRLALEQSTPDESLQVLLAYLGRCLRSERVYIFEEQPDGSVSNTYEWCSESAVPQKEALQNVPFEAVELWYRNFQKNQNVVIQDLEATKDSDPLAYEYLKPQNIFTLVVSPIVSDKGIIGFFGVDNAPAALLTHISVLMEIISHFIDSLLRRRNLVQRLELMSVYDQLTGLKNRHGMERHISCLREGNALGIFYLDVMGLKKTNDTLGHQAGDELLKRASACLREAFAGDELYRVGGDEFLVLCEGITEDELSRRQELLESIMKENDVQMAVGRVWKTQYAGDFDQMIETADAQMYEDKRRRYAMVRMTLA